MRQISYVKLGENKGTRRIWLEGKRLADAGIMPGSTYIVSFDDETKSISIDIQPGGPRKVSRKKRGDMEIPVIDIQSKQLSELFGENIERVQAIITDGKITVTIHPDDAKQAERFERITQKLRDNAPLDMGALCSGGGVLDLATKDGLNRAGIDSRLRFAVEKEPHYMDAALKNNPAFTADTLAIVGGIEEVDVDHLPTVDYLVAGLPCTGASLSGRAKNKLKFAEQHETAGSLFVAFLQIIKKVNPAIIALENVVQFGDTISMHVIRDVLTMMGYDIHEAELNGNDFGSLEKRKRMCMMAVTKGIPFDFEQLRSVREKEASLAEILESMEEDDPRWGTFDYLNKKEARDKAAGKGFAQQVLDASSETCPTVTAGYRKIRSTDPRLKHPTKQGYSRLFTPAEHARLKTIPEQLVDGLSETRAHQILGQSVIYSKFVAVGKLMGEMLRAAVGGTGGVTPLPMPSKAENDPEGQLALAL